MDFTQCTNTCDGAVSALKKTCFHNQSHDLIIVMLLKQIVKEREVCGEMVFTHKMRAHMILSSFWEFWSVPYCDI